MSKKPLLLGLVLAGTLCFPRLSAAQITGALFDQRASNMAWVSAGVGQGVDFQAWIGHGPLSAGYYRNNEYGHTTAEEHAALGALRIPLRHFALLLGAGAGKANRCTSNGEQSGTCTAAPEQHSAAAPVRGEVLIGTHLGFHLSYFTMTGSGAGYGSLTFGLEYGKLR